MDRRNFLLSSTLAATAVAVSPRIASAQGDEKQPLDKELVSRFVGRSHFDLEAVKEMLTQEPALVNATWDWGNGDWETGLGAASHTGQRAIAEHILEHGARIDVFAATMLGHTAILRVFLDAMPAIHQVPGPHGIPLLSHAVVGREPAFEGFQLLVDRGAAVNAASFQGMTPLMMAASIGHLQALDLLLAKGADTTARDSKDRTALAWAEEREQAAVVARLQSAAVVTPARQ